MVSFIFKHRVVLIITALVALGLFVTSARQRVNAQGATPCVNGMAGEYACYRVDLLARLSLEALGGNPEQDILANDIWGWTSPTSGKEYALVGLRNATAFVDISDPINPIFLGTLPAHQAGMSDYRDIKVYQNYAFIVADEPYTDHGMQVFDLADLDASAMLSTSSADTTTTFSEAAHYAGIKIGHNLWINEATGFAYIFRSDTCEQATHMVDIRDPLNPVTAGSGDGCYVSSSKDSDAECIVYDGPDTDYTDREICVTGSDESVTIGDVTDKDAPVVINVFTYPDVRRAHQGSFTVDRNYLLISDTMDEMMLGFNTRTHLIDVRDLDQPVYLGYYQHTTTATDHNVYIPPNGQFQGKYAVQTNWRAGLHILKIDNIPATNWSEAAFFDTYPADDRVGAKSGSWSSYPWFASGVVAVSDVESGLFLLQPHLEDPTGVTTTTLSGSVTNWVPILVVGSVLLYVPLLVLYGRQKRNG